MENPASPVAHDDITTFLIRSNSHYTKSKPRTAHPSRLRKLYQNPEDYYEQIFQNPIPTSTVCHFAKELPLEPGDDPAHPKYLIYSEGLKVLSFSFRPPAPLNYKHKDGSELRHIIKQHFILHEKTQVFFSTPAVYFIRNETVFGSVSPGTKTKIFGSSAYYKEIEPPVLLPTNEAIYLQGETVETLQLVKLDLLACAESLLKNEFPEAPEFLAMDPACFGVSSDSKWLFVAHRSNPPSISLSQLTNSKSVKSKIRRDLDLNVKIISCDTNNNRDCVMIGLELTQENEWVTNHLFLMSPNLNVVDTVEVKELSKNISLVHMVRTRLAQYVLVTSFIEGIMLYCISRSKLQSVVHIGSRVEGHRNFIMNVRVVPRAKKHIGPAKILFCGMQNDIKSRGYFFKHFASFILH